MKDKSQIKRILKTAGQLGLLVAFFVLAGFVLPIYLAPHLSAVLPVTTPYEAARETMSVRIENRNVSHGDTFSVGVSDPASLVRISSLSYSCDFPDITLAYVDGESIKEIPCDTDLQLPNTTQHELMLITSKSEVTYVPVELVLRSENQVGRISVVIAAASSDTETKSRLSDESTATLQSFPANN